MLPRYGFDCRERSWNQRWQYERLRRSSQRCLGWMPSPNNHHDDDDNQCLYNINLLETHLDHEPIIGKVWNVVARFPNVHRHIWLPDNGDWCRWFSCWMLKMKKRLTIALYSCFQTIPKRTMASSDGDTVYMLLISNSYKKTCLWNWVICYMHL